MLSAVYGACLPGPSASCLARNQESAQPEPVQPRTPRSEAIICCMSNAYMRLRSVFEMDAVRYGLRFHRGNTRFSGFVG
jgi:hypothetical protein